MSFIARTFLACVLLCVCAASAHAQSTGTISGTLTDEQTGVPLGPGPLGPLFIVYACPPESSYCNSSTVTASQASPDASGHYVIPNLAPGSYRVHVLAFSDSGYISEIHPNIPCVSADCTLQQGTAVTVAAGGTTTVDVALTKGGSIAGTVRRADTNAGVYRQLFVYNERVSPMPLRTIYTDFNTGSYVIPTLPAGSYYVHTGPTAFPDTAPFMDVVYPNGVCDVPCVLTQGTPITVTTGQTTQADFSLPIGGTISGTVTAADTGLPLSTTNAFFVFVGLIGQSGGSSVSTDSNGHYTISGVRTGRYYVKVGLSPSGAIPSPPLPYLPTYYGNVCEGCAGSPTVVTVTAGSTVSNVDIAVVPRPPTSGRITGAIHTAIDEAFGYSAHCASIGAYDAAGHLVGSGSFGGHRTLSPPNFPGWPTEYAIDDLPPGTYYVRFQNPACSSFSVWGFFGGITPDQTFGQAPCVTDDCDIRRGAPVTVSAGATTGGIDFTIREGGTISGIGGNSILYDDRGVRVSRSRYFQPGSFLGPNGPPSFTGLPDGTYYVRTSDGRLGGRSTCADCPATAGQPLVVKSGTLTQADLLPESTRRIVSGEVRDAASNAPLSSVEVRLLTAEGVQVQSDTTDAVGRFSFSNEGSDGLVSGSVPPGTYSLRTWNLRGYADRLYADDPCAGCDPSQAGTPIVVSSDVIANLTLPPGGLVSVLPTDAAGVSRKEQSIAIFDSTGRKVARDSNPFWPAIQLHLTPGTYYLRSEPQSGYVMTTYGAGACARGACDPATGTPLTVSLSTPVSVSLPIAACTPGDLSPSILASAVQGRAFRQVFRPSTPDTRVYVTTGRLPDGITLDAVTGVLSGTPTESGVFTFSIASIDPSGCAFVRQYSLQVAKCAFTLSPDSATVGAAGGLITVTASDVCGYSSIALRDNAWLNADAIFASGTTPLTIGVAPNPGPAARVGTISIGRRVFTVRQAGPASSEPFGSFDSPAPNAQVSGSVAVTGWALDDVEVVRVRIMREPVTGEAPGALVFIGNAVIVPGARPDVERTYPDLPRNDRAGWGYLLLTNMLPGQGNGTFVLHAIVDDAEGHAVDLGARTIVGANMSAIAPFGAIDTPSQGETIAGTAYRNWGWALTPQPKVIPTDGSTIQVLIDGVPIGSPVYNLFRPDVASLFPGLRNSGGPVGYRDLDTTALGEGVHTIAWIVTDSAAAGAGIGSRYFTVRNSADAQPAGLFQGPQTGQYAASLLAANGARSLRVSPLGRLRVAFSAFDDECRANYSAYLVANGEVRDLPAGAAISASGEFTWQPGPAFHGTYEFAIVTTGCGGAVSRASLLVRIGE